ncbi:MAG TPA: protein-disulfide reductase DsbD domain-containing protein [Pyrinomonadaceae bacterium]|nr:protein-disulfide reductase DsbD domain-containing protein [Pyrinomonadaceae bacterium]
MIPRISCALISLSLPLFVAACSGRSGQLNTNTTPAAAGSPAQRPATSVKFVKASAADVQIPAGGSAEATVTLLIQSGYHVNANPPTFSYLRATEVIVQTGEGISVGFITYPNPLIKKFSFAEIPLAVYEGSPTIKVMLKAIPTAAKGVRSLPAKLNVQACDNQVCYAPGTLELSIPATVK